MNFLKLLVVQNKVFLEKEKTLAEIKSTLERVCTSSIDIVTLGECFNSPYRKDLLHQNAEEWNESSTTLNLMKEISKKHKVYITGSIPEKEGEKFYNTAFLTNREGEIIAKYRKVHLFDIDLPNFKYQESDIFSPGNSFAVVETEFGKIGIGICYDVRFPEYSLALCKLGAKILLFPSAFSPATGPLHWEALLRGRAIDNQSYVIGTSTARMIENPEIYQAYGHSTVVDPKGQIAGRLAEDPGLLELTLDLSKVEMIRQSIPMLMQKKPELYSLNVNL